ncbi:hypothetical protein DPMN_023339 [Dreissena polymorpha]|uniref:Uncharacterized protein n=1 Tax=Dreissena polymorpha TaxID=45954 RepID=A0A9D4LLY0_DREPO|nr:hypothetical protein DPMN_023339 [Dreissena polymorpha]
MVGTWGGVHVLTARGTPVQVRYVLQIYRKNKPSKSSLFSAKLTKLCDDSTIDMKLTIHHS